MICNSNDTLEKKKIYEIDDLFEKIFSKLKLKILEFVKTTNIDEIDKILLIKIIKLMD